jgi:signal transduction histidine kinase
MFSAVMLVIIFLEISIALVTGLGFILVLSQYRKTHNPQDIYVSMVLFFGATADLGMLFAQVAYNLDSSLASVGFKIFLISALACSVFVWFHLSNIYDVHSKAVTIVLLTLNAASFVLVSLSKVSMTLYTGVIVPVGTGRAFSSAIILICLIVGMESLLSVRGLHELNSEEIKRFRISKLAGSLFLLFLICLFIYIFSNLLVFYVLMWFFAFFAMFFLLLFSMVPPESQLLDQPLNFFRTRILFKLVIVMVLMIVVSLEGMGIISMMIAKKALSTDIIEGYSTVAQDTIDIINRTKINTTSERASLKGIAKILEDTRIAARGSLFLLSPSGTIYINRNSKWIDLGPVGDVSAKLKLIKAKGGGEIDIFGEKVVAAFIPVNKIGWSIIVGKPIKYAYANISQMEGTFVMFVMFWIVCTVFLGVLIARNVEDPIKRIKLGMQRISNGDLDYRIKNDKLDELGELAEMFNKMTGQLKNTQNSLLRSERLAALGFMAAGMAHEIKNALVPLKTLTEILSATGGNTEFMTKFNELVPKEIERINTLSSDLLHYSRPAEPKFEPLDVNLIVTEATKFLEMQARTKRVSIKLLLSQVSNVHGDRQELLEVFTNIILNAIEAMDGGVITLSTAEENGKVLIKISDNGPGIPKASLEKIFVPFYTTKKEGTGMGLAITQRVIADHGGHIDVESHTAAEGAAGEIPGTTFTISLPARNE